MNEVKEYADMIDALDSTCNITVKKPKKSLFKRRDKNRKDLDSVKNELIEKVNAESETAEDNALSDITPPEPTAVIKKSKKEGKLGFLGVGIGVFAVIALTFAIILTNALFPNSAINVFFRSVFGVEQKVAVDERVYSDFDLSVSPTATVDENGVLTFSERGSLYPLANGTVSSVVKTQDGKYEITISHSDNFYTAISGLDSAYCSAGDRVYKTVPVGYTSGDATVCFLDKNSAVIASFTVVDNAVVWTV